MRVVHRFRRRRSQPRIAEAIAGEVQRSLDFYAATSAESLFSKVYLSGGSARLPALGRTISRTCGVPVELINPFANIAYDERTRQLLVTGKKWDKMYEVRLQPRPDLEPTHIEKHCSLGHPSGQRVG